MRPAQPPVLLLPLRLDWCVHLLRPNLICQAPAWHLLLLLLLILHQPPMPLAQLPTPLLPPILDWCVHPLRLNLICRVPVWHPRSLLPLVLHQPPMPPAQLPAPLLPLRLDWCVLPLHVDLICHAPAWHPPLVTSHPTLLLQRLRALPHVLMALLWIHSMYLPRLHVRQHMTSLWHAY